MSVRIMASSEEVTQEAVQEIIKSLAFRCLTIEEANKVLHEVKRQLEGIKVMDAYEMLYRDNLPK